MASSEQSRTCPDAFSRVQVEKVMQRCFLNDMEVWPRIRKEVQETLKQGRQPEVVQIKLELPPQMLEIQPLHFEHPPVHLG